MVDSLFDDCDVLLVNEMGKFNVVYIVVDFVFVGGSIVDWGGYNVFELVVRKLLVMMGLNIYNNLVICVKLVEFGGLFIVEDVDVMIEFIFFWCNDVDVVV